MNCVLGAVGCDQTAWIRLLSTRNKHFRLVLNFIPFLAWGANRLSLATPHKRKVEFQNREGGSKHSVIHIA